MTGLGILIKRVIVCVLLIGVPAPGFAQSYPNRPIRIIVPTGPSGSYDVVGRLVGDQLSKRLGQPIVVENRVGAGTVVGTQAAIASAPDGYSLLVGGLSNVVFNAALYKKPPYDPLNDLVPIAIVYNLSFILVGRSTLPYQSVNDIVAAARLKPDTLNLANAGVGTGQHVVGVAFMKLTGTKMLEVPYRGAAAVYPDLLAGRVDLFFDSITAALPYIKSGQLKGYAALTAERQPALPDVPTMAEMGIQNSEVDSWIGIFAPAKTPDAIVKRLQSEIQASLPDLKAPFEKVGGNVLVIPPEKLDGFVRSEYEKWTTIIKGAKISLD